MPGFGDLILMSGKRGFSPPSPCRQPPSLGHSVWPELPASTGTDLATPLLPLLYLIPLLSILWCLLPFLLHAGEASLWLLPCSLSPHHVSIHRADPCRATAEAYASPTDPISFWLPSFILPGNSEGGEQLLTCSVSRTWTLGSPWRAAPSSWPRAQPCSDESQGTHFCFKGGAERLALPLCSLSVL